jgi:hypothetical protein
MTFLCLATFRVAKNRNLMNEGARYVGLVVLVVMAILLASLDLYSPAQNRDGDKSECGTLDKSKPMHFISPGGMDRKAWDGGRYVKGVVLRLTNNCSCPILLVTPPGSAPRLLKKGGKYIWQNDWDTPQLRNGSQIDLVYTFHFPQSNRLETPVPSGDVILRSKLLSGESVLFSVPVRLVKQGGDIEVLFSYESNPKAESVHFSSLQLPKTILR